MTFLLPVLCLFLGGVLVAVFLRVWQQHSPPASAAFVAGARPAPAGLAFPYRLPAATVHRAGYFFCENCQAVNFFTVEERGPDCIPPTLRAELLRNGADLADISVWQVPAVLVCPRCTTAHANAMGELPGAVESTI